MQRCVSGVRRVSYILLIFISALLLACSEQEPAATSGSVEVGDQAAVAVEAPVETATPDQTAVQDPATRSDAVSKPGSINTGVVSVTTSGAGKATGLDINKPGAKQKKSAGQNAKKDTLGKLSSNSVTIASKQKAVSAKGKSVTAAVTDAGMVVIAPDIAKGDLSTLDVYKVKLAADAQLDMPGSPGELIIWIGAPSTEKRFDIGMVTDESSVPAIGETARVRPHAPDFEIKPEESECIKIHRSGSEVRFQLVPKEAGTFEVGASVKLFESDDCSGAPVPKVVENLVVEVVVNEGKLVEQGLGQLLAVAWEKFLEFWGALVALILALLLFAVRGKFKKWFGFE